MKPKISVITCSHNSRPDYLSEVIDSLAQQTLSKELWEYLLIDNGSKEPLSSSADISWHANARIIREEKLGLTPARLRGIGEAVGKLLVFVDDDNVLNPDYLIQAASLAEMWPMIGAFSGQVKARFEEQPPEWTKRYWNRLAIREFDHDRWSNIPCLDHTTPNGAGLCVRRQVAEEYARYHQVGKRNFVLDRTGNSLLSAGDLDLATTACDLGLGNALFASLKLTHLIPPERLEEEYLLRLFEDQTFSHVILDSFRSNGREPSRRSWKSSLAEQLRIMSKDRRERRFIRAAAAGQRRALQYLGNGTDY